MYKVILHNDRTGSYKHPSCTGPACMLVIDNTVHLTTIICKIISPGSQNIQLIYSLTVLYAIMWARQWLSMVNYTVYSQIWVTPKVQKSVVLPDYQLSEYSEEVT